MSIPLSSDLETLQYGYRGLPNVRVGSSGMTSWGLAYTYKGLPNLFAPAVSATITVINVSSVEYISGTDIVTVSDFAPASSIEAGTVLDNMSIIVTVRITEGITCYDTAHNSQGTQVSDYSGMRISIGATRSNSSGTRISVGETAADTWGTKMYFGSYVNDSWGTNIIIGENSLLPVTSVCSTSNPFEPTIYIGGVGIVNNPSTDPGSTAVQYTDIYLHWLSTGVDGNDWTDLFNFTFNLNYSDGNFSIVSKRPPLVETIDYGLPPIQVGQTYVNPVTIYGSIAPTTVDAVAQAHLGKQTTVFGFTGTITDFGATISDQQAAYTTQGMFGNPIMHKQVNLIMTAGYLLNLATNQTLNASNSGSYGNCQSLVSALANLAGASLLWAVQNQPLTNTFKISGMTVMQAISSLAAMCNGVLRWNGMNSYVVAYPDQYFGTFTIPSASLLTSTGVAYLQHYDLTTGLSGTGILLLPTLNGTSPIVNAVNPNAKQGSALPPLQRIGKISTVLTSDDPPQVMDLPYNYENVYIQLLVGVNGDTGGVIPASVSSFITKDPSEWFLFDISSLSAAGSDYIFQAYLGNQYIPQVQADYNLFPPSGANTSIDAGEFVLNFACSTHNLSALFNNAVTANQTIASTTIGFIKTYSATISFQFYGSIPLPGMWGSVTIPGGATCYSYNLSGEVVDSIPINGGDFTVQGVIEDVSFTYPGIVQLTLAQYVRINYLESGASNVSILTS